MKKTLKIKKENTFKKLLQKSHKGFTMGVAMVIMAILVTVSLGMSILLLRDLKQASVTEKSSEAYNLSDGFMSCLTSYENTIKHYTLTGDYDTGLFPESVSFNYDSNYKDINTDNSGSHRVYEKNSITCFGLPILLSNPAPYTLGRSNFTVVSADSSNLATPTTSSPIIYNKGVKTIINLQTTEMKNKNDTCLVAEIYSTSTQDKLFITRAKTPCSGSKIIERVIARYIQ